MLNFHVKMYTNIHHNVLIQIDSLCMLCLLCLLLIKSSIHTIHFRKLQNVSDVSIDEVPRPFDQINHLFSIFEYRMVFNVWFLSFKACICLSFKSCLMFDFFFLAALDRNSVVYGKSVYLGGLRINKKK
eukprot:1162654_1